MPVKVNIGTQLALLSNLIYNMDTTENEVKSSVSKEKQIKGAEQLVKYYLLPLVMAVSSLVIFLLWIIPTIQAVLDNIGQIQTQEENFNKLKVRRQQIQDLQAISNDQVALLELVNKIIPQSQTAVVGFTEKIRETAASNKVDVTDSITGEVVSVTNADAAQQNGLELVELPADFSANGTLANIRSFLTALYNNDDFIIIKSMELQRLGSNIGTGSNENLFNPEEVGDWTIKLTLVKYQLRTPSGLSEADIKRSFFSVPETARPQQSVLDFIKQNYQD